MRLIYPSDTFNPKSADEVYSEEFAEAQSLGFETSLFSFEEFQSGQFRPRPAFGVGETVLFRTWMMTPEDYSRLCSSVEAFGSEVVTSPESYRLCHHLPQWYPALSDYTAETRTFSEEADIAEELAAAGWSRCFLKDYVKSLSTDGGSLVQNLSDIPAVVGKMRKYRGSIEGGLCARKLEEYDAKTERRYFVWRGTPHSDDGIVPAIVQLAASRISSPFFTVDVAQRRDGTLRIVELGDGQVSDRKHWSSYDLLCLLR